MVDPAGETGEIAAPARGHCGPSAARSREAEPAGSMRVSGDFAPTSPQHTSGGSQQHIPHTTESGLVERHVNTGLYATVTTNSIGEYYRARYYDPTRGRFVSEDPLGPWGGTNAFAYVSDDPIAARDPQGLFAIQATGLLAGAVLGGASAVGGAIAAGGSPTQVAVAAAVGATLGGVGAAINPGALFTGGVNMAASAAGQMIGGKDPLDVNLTLLATSAVSASGVMGVGNLVREAMAGSWLTRGIGVAAMGQASIPARAAAGLLGRHLPVTARDLGEWMRSADAACPESGAAPAVPTLGPFAP